jgi:hypothetical protein
MSTYSKQYYEEHKEQAKLIRLRHRLNKLGVINLTKVPEYLFFEYLGGTKQQVIDHLDKIVLMKHFPLKAYNNINLFKIDTIITDINIPRSTRYYYKNLTIRRNSKHKLIRG